MMNSTLCIDQLLRAAQLLEQQQSQAAAAALLLGQAAHVQPNAFALQLCKLGGQNFYFFNPRKRIIKCPFFIKITIFANLN